MSEKTKSEAVAAEPAPKRKKPLVVAAVVAVVLVIAGAGFWVWHEQPSFCGAICHVSMDSYLPTYESNPGSEGVDKWGNAVSDSSAMLAPVHRVQGIGCTGCHVPVIGEQISEGLEWVTGNYTVVSTGDGSYALEERGLDELVAARGVASEQFCLRSGCHVTVNGDVMTRDDLIAATSDRTRNPHVQQHGEVACSECHKAHRASTVYCSKCHSDTEIPEGWLDYSEAQQLAEN